MISCISPSFVYFEETLLTLNYSNRVRNIKNKPIINSEGGTQKISDLIRENQLLKIENNFLKEQWQRAVF